MLPAEKGSSSNQQWFKPQGSRVGKYRLDTDDEDAAYSSISMDILGMSSMELDPEVCARTRPNLLALPQNMGV